MLRKNTVKNITRSINLAGKTSKRLRFFLGRNNNIIAPLLGLTQSSIGLMNGGNDIRTILGDDINRTMTFHPDNMKHIIFPRTRNHNIPTRTDIHETPVMIDDGTLLERQIIHSTLTDGIGNLPTQLRNGTNKGSHHRGIATDGHGTPDGLFERTALTDNGQHRRNNIFKVKVTFSIAHQSLPVLAIAYNAVQKRTDFKSISRNIQTGILQRVSHGGKSFVKRRGNHKTEQGISITPEKRQIRRIRSKETFSNNTGKNGQLIGIPGKSCQSTGNYKSFGMRNTALPDIGTNDFIPISPRKIPGHVPLSCRHRQERTDAWLRLVRPRPRAAARTINLDLLGRGEKRKENIRDGPYRVIYIRRTNDVATDRTNHDNYLFNTGIAFYTDRFILLFILQIKGIVRLRGLDIGFA